MDERNPATPAPFTPDQVDALTRGLADEAEIGALLEAHVPPSRTARAQRSRKRSPVRLSERELADVARGETPQGLAGRLEAAETKDAASLAQTGPEKEQPTKHPPASSRRR
jgi:hypothetical protein